MKFESIAFGGFKSGINKASVCDQRADFVNIFIAIHMRRPTKTRNKVDLPL